MLETAAACPPSGSGVDAATELHRQARLIDDLAQRLEAVVRALPRDSAIERWWGPARDAMQGAVGVERARLEREIRRLEGVRIQVQFAAGEAAALTGRAGGVP